ncbi:MAG: hypothetical protein LBE20_03830 [Deltaproteobacteria bacterium]|jgi:cytidylate kinase|nr:hypothetical protein [Deltaproteobacteria bacterium]
MNNLNPKHFEFVAKRHELEISHNLKLVNLVKAELYNLAQTQKIYRGYTKLLNSKPQPTFKSSINSLKQEREFALFCEVLKNKVTLLSEQLAEPIKTHQAKIAALLKNSQLSQRKREVLLNKIKQIKRLQKLICENNDSADLEDKLAFKSATNHEF